MFLCFSLDISSDKTRVAVISSAGSISISLDNSSMSQASVHSAIDSLVSPSSPEREMASSLNVATNMLKNEGRNNVPKFILMAVFGESGNQNYAKFAAAFAQHSGIHVFTWGFGAAYADNGVLGDAGKELRFFAKDGASAFKQPDINDDVTSSDVSKAICDGRFQLLFYCKVPKVQDIY